VRSASKSVLTALALLALYVIWGSTYFAMRVALETVPPFLMAGPRFLIAGIAMALVLRARGAAWPTREQWLGSAALGFCLLTLGNGAVAFAEQSVPSSVAAIIVASVPIWIALLGRLSGLPPRGGEWPGILLGFVGVLLLEAGDGLHLDARGTVLLLGPVAWAAGSLWSRRLPLPNGAMATAAQMLTAGVTLLLIALITGERLPRAPSVRSLVAIAYLTVFGSIVAFSAYNWLLRNVRPALATSYAYINPLVALLLGSTFGKESVTWFTVAAAGFSVGGVALIALGTHRQRAASVPAR
jgi:drug/metabolite transporter (DMT)-like permease